MIVVLILVTVSSGCGCTVRPLVHHKSWPLISKIIICSQSPTLSQRADPVPSPVRNGRVPLYPGAPISPPLPLNNINSPSTANGMRLSYPSHHYVNLSHLESFSWFAGEMERDVAQAVLADQPNGTFLVRVRPLQTTGRGSIQSVTSLSATDAAYALSLKCVNVHVSSFDQKSLMRWSCRSDCTDGDTDGIFVLNRKRI